MRRIATHLVTANAMPKAPLDSARSPQFAPCAFASRQIEAARIAVTRSMKREGKVWIRVFPDKPLTSKPADVRMGKGKGGVDHYVAEIAPGRIIFEVEGVTQELAQESLRLAAQKLPIICKFITRHDYEA